MMLCESVSVMVAGTAAATGFAGAAGDCAGLTGATGPAAGLTGTTAGAGVATGGLVAGFAGRCVLAGTGGVVTDFAAIGILTESHSACQATATGDSRVCELIK